MFFRLTVAVSLILVSSSGASADDDVSSSSSIRGALNTKNKKPWRPDLPWNQLRSKLQYPSSLTHASVDQPYNHAGSVHHFVIHPYNAKHLLL